MPQTNSSYLADHLHECNNGLVDIIHVAMDDHQLSIGGPAELVRLPAIRCEISADFLLHVEKLGNIDMQSPVLVAQK